jgi:hypothetical protein
MDSFLKVIDLGLQATVYAKFQTTMGITSLTNDTALWPKALALRKIAEKRGAVTMEFINVWRVLTAPDPRRSRTAVAVDGIPLQYTSAEKLVITNTQAVAVNLDYNIWFWSKDKDKLNAIAQECMFWKYNNPVVSINYDGTYPLDFFLHLGEVIDESPLEGAYDRGTYFVIRVPLTLEGWLLQDILIPTVKKIVISIYDEELATDILVSQETINFTP